MPLQESFQALGLWLADSNPRTAIHKHLTAGAKKTTCPSDCVPRGRDDCAHPFTGAPCRTGLRGLCPNLEAHDEVDHDGGGSRDGRSSDTHGKRRR